MVQTRVEKHQNYRSSLLKEGTDALRTSEHFSKQNNTLGATTTLPIEEVMDTLNDESEEAEFLKKQIKRRYFTISAIIISLVVIAAVIAIVAIVLFRGS